MRNDLKYGYIHGYGYDEEYGSYYVTIRSLQQFGKRIHARRNILHGRNLFTIYYYRTHSTQKHVRFFIHNKGYGQQVVYPEVVVEPKC